MTKRTVVITTSILVSLISIFAILFGVVFRVRNIKIVCSNDFCYQSQIDDILTSSKLRKNTSIFNVNRTKITNNIELAYPYARVEGVTLTSFTSVKIRLSNRLPMYYLVEDAVYYILDEDCKVLNITNDSAEATKYILLNNVFSVSKSTSAGQFLGNRYTQVCTGLYNALYTSAMLELENGDGVLEDRYLEREDMYDIIRSVKFEQVDELNGKVDKLIMTTSYGVGISIIDPQQSLELKVNMVFSALRELIARGNNEHTTGTIVIRYSYNNNHQPVPQCEYQV